MRFCIFITNYSNKYLTFTNPNTEVIVMIGERLREIRKMRGITQEELAALVGTQKSAISSYENNKSEPNDRYKIIFAKKLNISLDYLLGTIDTPIYAFNKRKMILINEDLSEAKRTFLNQFINMLNESECFIDS